MIKDELKKLLKENFEVELKYDRGHLEVTLTFDNDVLHEDSIMIDYNEWVGGY